METRRISNNCQIFNFYEKCIETSVHSATNQNKIIKQIIQLLFIIVRINYINTFSGKIQVCWRGLQGKVNRRVLELLLWHVRVWRWIWLRLMSALKTGFLSLHNKWQKITRLIYASPFGVSIDEAFSIHPTRWTYGLPWFWN